MKRRDNWVVPFALTTVAVLCSAPFPAWAERPPEKVQERPRSTKLRSPRIEVPLDLSGSQPAVSVRINGKEAIPLPIHTTLSGLMLAGDMDRMLGFKAVDTTTLRNAPTGATGSAGVAPIQSLALGDAVFADFEAFVIKHDERSAEGARYTGALGLNLFAGFLVTLDFPHGRLILKRGALPPADGREVFEYTAESGFPAIPLTFGDVTVNVAIDAAAPGAFRLADSIEEDVELVLGPAPASEGPRTFRVPAFPPFSGTVRVGRYALVNPPIGFRQHGSHMGRGVLQHFALTFDVNNRRLRLTRTGVQSITFPPSKPKFGLTFIRVGKSLRIAEVFPGTPAAEMPLARGGFITAVNGRAVTSYDDHELATFLHDSDSVVLAVTYQGRGALLVPLTAAP